MDAHWLLVAKRAQFAFGISVAQIRASSLSLPRRHPHVTRLQLVPIQTYASVVAAMEILLFGICITKNWCANSKGTLTAHRVLIYHQTALSYGLAVSIILFDHGIYGKAGNYSNTISHHKSSPLDIARVASGWLLGKCVCCVRSERMYCMCVLFVLFALHCAFASVSLNSACVKSNV